MLPSDLYPPEQDPGTYAEDDGTEVDWLQPAPDAMLTPNSADPAAIVTAREGLRLALIASLQYLPPRQRAVLVLRDVLAFPATEAALAVLDWARSSGYERLWATVWEWNTASRRVLAKVGFTETERKEVDAVSGTTLFTTRQL